MTVPADPVGLGATLLVRLRAAEPKIVWRSVTGPAKRRRGRFPLRVAHLFQEEAKVGRTETGGSVELRVDPGPLGALLVLLEADRRMLPPQVASLNAGRDPEFPDGCFVARWGAGPSVAGDAPLDLRQLVELARYALP